MRCLGFKFDAEDERLEFCLRLRVELRLKTF